MAGKASIILQHLTLWDTSEHISVRLPLASLATDTRKATTEDASGPALLDDDGALRAAIQSATRSMAAGKPVDVVVDCSAYTLAPGLCDPHVHFRDPGQTQKESMTSGCAAAASGGYTNVLIMPNTVPALDGRRLHPGMDGAQDVLDAGFDSVVDYLQHYAEFSGESLPVRYELCVAASTGREGHVASRLQDWEPYLRNGGSDGNQSTETHPIVAISDDGAAITDGILDEVAANARQAGIPIVDHCEHHDSGVINDGRISRKLGVPGIPASTELTIVQRDIALARRTGQHVHLQHVSTAAAFEAIRQAKRDGLQVSCETAPHYLALCDEDVLEHGTLAKMNPPLRSAADREATIEAVRDGTVDMLATDHAPHTVCEKAQSLLDAPNGIIGLETAYGVCHQVLVDGGYIDDRRLIELMSVAPARLMGEDTTDVDALLAVGEPTDSPRVLDLRQSSARLASEFSILAPGERWTIDPEQFHSRARNTPFASWTVTGRPMATLIASSFAFSRIPASRISTRNSIESES
ncbi:dihydroorotase [Bifidobacterium crudilactis]|jgi:dihydroorotase